MDADTDNSILNWLKQIEQVCACLDTVSVNIIVDQAGDAPSLVHDLMRFQPQIAWVSLLENEPENEFIEDAPLFCNYVLMYGSTKSGCQPYFSNIMIRREYCSFFCV